MCIQNLKTLALIEAKKFVTENLLGEEEKLTNKAMIRAAGWFSFTQYNKSYPTFVPNFKIIGAVVPEKSFDTNFPMYYIGVRDGKKEKWKEKAKINHRILVFFLTIYLAPLKVYTKFENSGCYTSWEFWDEKFYWRERKMDK